MPDERALRLTAVPPPFLYLATFFAGIGIDSISPWLPLWLHAFDWFGWTLIVIGILLGPASAVLFLIRHTTLDPGGQPSKLVTDGAYRISRNPMYLGLSLLYAGLAIVLGYAWSLVLLPIPWIVMSAVFIPREEARMRAIFGEEFLEYSRKVRRWI